MSQVQYFIGVFAVGVMALTMISYLRMILNYPKSLIPMRGEDIAIRIGLIGLFSTVMTLLLFWLFDIPRTTVFLFLFQGGFAIFGTSLTVGFVMTVGKMRRNQLPLIERHRYPPKFHDKEG